ncbi:MAG: ABC transporter ATP-binding protein [Pikeienuella sp.]
MTEAQTTSQIRFASISKTFVGANGEEFKALRDINLEIGANEFFTLLGPSGCGKTTLLRMLAGFEDPSSGEILLDGQNLVGIEPNKRPVNTVFQSYALFPHMTVSRNIAFGLEMLGWDQSRVAARVREVIALVQLERFADRMPSQLSGGQQQRVALARALAPNPKVLLLDEPLSALDLKLRKEMQVEMTRIRQGTDTTFLFVTHDQEEALTMSDRIAVMNAGRIQQVGTPDEIYFRPATRFVADFIGEMNFLDGRATAADTVALTDGGAPLALGPDAGLKPGEPATLAIRPEFCRVADEPDAARNRIAGRVRQRIFAGAHTTLIVELPGGERINCRLDAETGRSDAHAEGSDIHVELPAQYLLAVSS